MSIRNYRFLSRGRLVIVILTASLLLVWLLALASGRLRGAKLTVIEKRAENEYIVAVPHNQRNRTTLLESEVVAVTDRGFEPTAITRSQGEFILMNHGHIWLQPQNEAVEVQTGTRFCGGTRVPVRLLHQHG